MRNLKAKASLSVVYRGLDLQVPVDTNFMWVHPARNGKLFVVASTAQPKWNTSKGYYTGVAYETVCELDASVKLSVAEIKNSLETEDAAKDVKPKTAQSKVSEALQQAEDIYAAQIEEALSGLETLANGLRAEHKKYVEANKGKPNLNRVFFKRVVAGTEGKASAIQANLETLVGNLHSADEAAEVAAEAHGFKDRDAIYAAAGLQDPEGCTCPACSGEDTIPPEVVEALKRVFGL